MSEGPGGVPTGDLRPCHLPLLSPTQLDFLPQEWSGLLAPWASHLCGVSVSVPGHPSGPVTSPGSPPLGSGQGRGLCRQQPARSLAQQVLSKCEEREREESEEA